MPRFFCPEPMEVGATIVLPEKVAHHVYVLRLDADATITLFNGEGGEYSARLLAPEKKEGRTQQRTLAQIKVHHPLEIELPYALTLAQALPEGSKMDWIVEKAVELGAFGLQALSSQRSVVKLNEERAQKKHEHWRNIVVSASEQCGRNRLMRVAGLSSFQDWISQQDLHRRVLLSPRAMFSLSDWARHHPPQALTIMVGPEGGFTEAEESMAIQHDALMLGLGPRVLRTETCGMAALTTLNAIWGGI
jgi:16S rRNA (uracil1498-N3)-methyltransferase